jgi:hypothetical protein
MYGVRFRYLLPYGHLLIDVICLVVGVWHLNAIRGRVKSDLNPQPIVHPALLQEAGAPGWDFRHVYIPPVEEYVFLGLGNLPACIVAVSIRPHGMLMPMTRGPLWDTSWLLIQESLAFPLWFAAGILADSRGGLFAGWCRWFIAARFLFAVFLLAPGIARLGLFAEILFWFALFGYALLRALAWCFSALRAASANVRSS